MGLLKRVTGAAHTLGAVVLGLMFTFMVLNIIGRSIGHQLVWVGEFSSYAVVWAVYLGVALVLREGGHVKVELVSERLPPRARAVMRILGDDLPTMVFSIFVVWRSAYMVQVAWQTQRETPLLGIPVWPLLAVLPLGMALFGLEALADAVAVARSLSKGVIRGSGGSGSLEE
ncbi:MAG: TRAP transporter small permease [Firmicutes bacterium]|nr:TRAP transporter small permease [Bacillota bacterium]